MFRDSCHWSGDGNLYANSDTFIRGRPSSVMRRRAFSAVNLDDWLRFWGNQETRASYIEMRVRDFLTSDQMPKKMDDISAAVHLNIPEEILAKTEEPNSGVDASLLGQGVMYDKIRDSAAYKQWLERVLD